MSDQNRSEASDFFCAVVLAVILIMAMMAMPIGFNQGNDATTTVSDVPIDSYFIAVHLYYGHWIDYNGSVDVHVPNRIESGDCLGSWFLTDYKYERGINYSITINGTHVKDDWVSLYGDMGTWKGEQWFGYVGSQVEVCHVNLSEVVWGCWCD